jgi:PEP-CTERM motif
MENHMNTKKYFHLLTAGAAMAVLSGLPSFSKATTVVVDPSNMNGWTLNAFDDTGAINPSAGTAEMVTGPATPPLGVGSAHLATAPGFGDGAAAIATEGYDGTLLNTITSLSYSTYDTTNNGQQFPYLAISINTNDLNNDTDTLFFEPPYQQPSTGNPALPDQGAPVQNQWQNWNALVGGFWDNNGIGNPGTPEGLTPGVEPLATFEAAYPLATIANGGFPGLGGIAMQVGFAGASDNFDGNVDAFTIGVGGVDTTYDFEPTAVPEPASFSLLGIGALALLRRRRRA